MSDYRLVCRYWDFDESSTIGIHEVEYNVKTGEPSWVSPEETILRSVDSGELHSEMVRMLLAFDKPILFYSDFPVVFKPEDFDLNTVVEKTIAHTIKIQGERLESALSDHLRALGWIPPGTDKKDPDVQV